MRATAAAALSLGASFLAVSCGGGSTDTAAGPTSPSPAASVPATTTTVDASTTTVDDPTKEQAIEVVTNVVKAHAAACGSEVLRASAERVPGVGFWRVRLKVRVPDFTGWATWTVEKGKPIPNEEYAGYLENEDDCSSLGFG